MTTLQDLVEYFSSGRPLVVIGAGPSCDARLPTWGSLTEALLVQLRTLKGVDIESVEESFANRNYSKAFGDAVKITGEKWVYEFCKEALGSPSDKRDQYQLISQLPAHGFLTTNFDSLLHAQFDSQKLASIELLNDAESLSAVDFESQLTIVKLHSDFLHPDTLVLTEKQYRDVIHGSRFEGLRSFISAYLLTNRIVFIGYSLNDPDFNFLLDSTVYRLRRKVPLFGIVADASPKDVDEWYERFNLRVLTYKAPAHDHSDLKNILSSVVAHFSSGPANSNVPFNAAQSLYMWHKLRSSMGTAATADAFKSLLLGVMAEISGPLSSAEIKARLSKKINLPAQPESSAAIDQALAAMARENLLLRATSEAYEVTVSGKAIHASFSKQFGNLKALFDKQVAFDLEDRLPKAPPESRAEIVQLIHDCMVQIFSERGGELANSFFSEKFENPSSLNLLKTVNSFTARLKDRSRFAAFSYIMELVTKPKAGQRPYLEYLAKAFFAAQAIGVDPDGQSFRREALRNRTLLIDANILIPLLAKNSAKQAYFSECVRLLRDAGLTLRTIPSFCDEALFHFQWGVEHIHRYGAQSVEVLECALGTTEFRRNEFVDGYIRSGSEAEITLDDYIMKCFGSGLDFNAVRAACSTHGIELVSFNEIGSERIDMWNIRMEVEKYIENQQMYSDNPKSDLRIKAEAYAYTVCYGWGLLCPKDAPQELWRCSVLSQGTSLNRVARWGPHPLARPVVIRPDSLQEFIQSFVSVKQTTSIGDVMLATYVQGVDYFIDKEKYADFFQPLIRDAEAIYTENLDRFQELVGGRLSLDELDGYQELDRPLVVDSLRKRILADAERKSVDLAMQLSNVRTDAARAEELARRALSQLSPQARKRLEREMQGFSADEIDSQGR